MLWFAVIKITEILIKRRTLISIIDIMFLRRLQTSAQK